MSKIFLFSVISILLLLFVRKFYTHFRNTKTGISFSLAVVGFIFGFFDTMGIGGFAPTLSYLKNIEKIKLIYIPNILLLSFAIPTVLQTFIFVSSVNIRTDILIFGIISPVIGYVIFNYLSRFIPSHFIKFIVGIGLILSGTMALVQNLGLAFNASHSGVITLTDAFIIYAGTFVFGALTNFGIGNFSPTLILFELLGLDPRMGFPMMMAACAIIMLINGIKKRNIESINIRIPLSVTTGMILAVPLAAYLIHSLDVSFISWMVIIVVIISGLQTLLDKKAI